MQRARIVNRRRHSGLAASFGELVAPLGDDGILGPDRACAFHQPWCLHDRGEAFGVTIGTFLPRDDLLREDGKLLQKDGSLERVEPAVETDLPAFGPVGMSAMAANRDEKLRLSAVISENSASVAIATERLRRIEAGRRVVRECPDLAHIQTGTEALRRIGEQ